MKTENLGEDEESFDSFVAIAHYNLNNGWVPAWKCSCGSVILWNNEDSQPECYRCEQKMILDGVEPEKVN